VKNCSSVSISEEADKFNSPSELFLSNKKGNPLTDSPYSTSIQVNVLSAEVRIVAAGPVGKDCRIQHLPAACALPGIKGTDKVIKLLGKHTAFAAWALHGNPPDDVIALNAL
jgi:hypothetical protein